MQPSDGLELLLLAREGAPRHKEVFVRVRVRASKGLERRLLAGRVIWRTRRLGLGLGLGVGLGLGIGLGLGLGLGSGLGLVMKGALRHKEVELGLGLGLGLGLVMKPVDEGYR